MALVKANQRSLDQVADVVNRVLTLRGGPGIRVVNSSCGITISLDRTNAPAVIQSNAGAPLGGQYLYTVYSTVAQNVAGWDYVRAHP